MPKEDRAFRVMRLGRPSGPSEPKPSPPRSDARWRGGRTSSTEGRRLAFEVLEICTAYLELSTLMTRMAGGHTCPGSHH
jgi:hypothetical protein